MEPVERKFIQSASAPAPGGPYSQGVQVGRTLYLSGQIGTDPKTGNLVSGGIEAQTRQVLVNLGHVLNAANADYRSVVKATVLLADINDFDAMNGIYKEFFKDKYPARAAYQVGKLPKGSLIEIEAIAFVGPISNM